MATQLNLDASQITLDPLLASELNDLIASGRFDSCEEVIREGMRLLREREECAEVVDWDALDPEERAGIERGLADVEAGRVKPAEQVFAELRHRYENWL